MTSENRELRITEEESQRISILKVWLSVMVVFIHMENEINTASGAIASLPGWVELLEFVINRAVHSGFLYSLWVNMFRH